MNLSKKAKIKFGMFISLCCVCAATIPMVTYAWFKQYLDISGTRIEISSGESVAYIEVELYTYKNGKLGDRLAFHTSTGNKPNIGATTVDTSAQGDTGTVVINFNKIPEMNIDILNSQGDDGNPDFFDPDGLPELVVEFRFIKDLFNSYIKSSAKVLTNSGTNNYYDPSTNTNKSKPLDTPYQFKDLVVVNDTANVMGYAAKNITANNLVFKADNPTEVDFLQSGDNTNMDTMRSKPAQPLPTINTSAPMFPGQGFEIPQLEVTQFNKKRPDDNKEVAFSKALLLDVCLNPELIYKTYSQTNKGMITKDLTFNLKVEFTFELSNDPYQKKV